VGRGELNRNPGAYLGVTPTTPPNLVTSTRPPTTKDYRGFSIGDLWLDTNLQDLFILVSKAGLTSQQEGTWLTLGGQAGNVNDFETDDGNIVVPNAGRVNVFGGSNMNTTGAIASTITINLNDFITWPATNAAGDEGVIYIDGQSVLHTYDAVNSPSHNLFAGEAAGNFTLTTAEENVGLGTLSLASLTTGDDNVGVGYNTLSLLENGIRNVAINSNALGNAVSTNDCIAIGKDALVGATVEIKSIAIGTQASAGGNGHTIAIGTNAMLLNTNPVGQNVAIGEDVMVSNIDSEQTVAIGNSVLGSLTTGNLNTSIGYGSLSNLVDGINNHVFGAGSGGNYAGTESSNILISNLGVAGESNAIRIGGFNQVIGGPIAIGVGALPVTSDTNIAIGAESLNLLNSVTGVDNLALGIRSLRDLDTGFRNISIGYEAGVNYTSIENSNIVIGNEGVIGDSNTIRIGTEGSITGQQDEVFIAGIYNTTGLTSTRNVIVDANGQLGTGIGLGFQSAFSVSLGGAVPNATGNATDYYIIHLVTNYDLNSDYNNGTGLFTAPIDGIYTFKSVTTLDDINNALFTEAVIYLSINGAPGIIGGMAQNAIATRVPNVFQRLNLLINADFNLSAGDTVALYVQVSNGPKTVEVEESVFSGYLVYPL